MPKSRLTTPEGKAPRLQQRLRQSAKRDPRRRFHQLLDKVWSPWVLQAAWQRVKANRGAPGPDGVTIEQVETLGVEKFLDDLSRDPRARSYRPDAGNPHVR